MAYLSAVRYELEVKDVSSGAVFNGTLDNKGNVHDLPSLPPGQYTFRTKTLPDASGGEAWTGWIGFNAQGAPFLAQAQGVVPKEPIAKTTKESYSQPNVELESAMTCCGSPDPAILEKNSRLYCRNCKRYLDVPPPGDRQTVAPKPPKDREVQ